MGCCQSVDPAEPIVPSLRSLLSPPMSAEEGTPAASSVSSAPLAEQKDEDVSANPSLPEPDGLLHHTRAWRLSTDALLSLLLLPGACVDQASSELLGQAITGCTELHAQWKHFAQTAAAAVWDRLDEDWTEILRSLLLAANRARRLACYLPSPQRQHPAWTDLMELCVLLHTRDMDAKTAGALLLAGAPRLPPAAAAAVDYVSKRMELLTEDDKVYYGDLGWRICQRAMSPFPSFKARVRLWKSRRMRFGSAALHVWQFHHLAMELRLEAAEQQQQLVAAASMETVDLSLIQQFHQAVIACKLRKERFGSLQASDDGYRLMRNVDRLLHSAELTGSAAAARYGVPDPWNALWDLETRLLELRGWDELLQSSHRISEGTFDRWTRVDAAEVYLNRVVNSQLDGESTDESNLVDVMPSIAQLRTAIHDRKQCLGSRCCFLCSLTEELHPLCSRCGDCRCRQCDPVPHDLCCVCRLADALPPVHRGAFLFSGADNGDPVDRAMFNRDITYVMRAEGTPASSSSAATPSNTLLDALRNNALYPPSALPHELRQWMSDPQQPPRVLCMLRSVAVSAGTFAEGTAGAAVPPAQQTSHEELLAAFGLSKPILLFLMRVFFARQYSSSRFSMFAGHAFESGNLCVLPANSFRDEQQGDFYQDSLSLLELEHAMSMGERCRQPERRRGARGVFLGNSCHSHRLISQLEYKDIGHVSYLSNGVTLLSTTCSAHMTVPLHGLFGLLQSIVAAGSVTIAGVAGGDSIVSPEESDIDVDDDSSVRPSTPSVVLWHSSPSGRAELLRAEDVAAQRYDAATALERDAASSVLLPLSPVVSASHTRRLHHVRHFSPEQREQLCGVCDMLAEWMRGTEYEMHHHESTAGVRDLSDVDFFKFRDQLDLDAADAGARPASGIYCFPASYGDTYAIYDHQSQLAILFDSGKRADVFALFCWNAFFRRFVRSFIAVVSHIDDDHVAGLRTLVLQTSRFGSSTAHPHCTAIYINTPESVSPSSPSGVGSPHQGKYGSMDMMLARLHKLSPTLSPQRLLQGDIVPFPCAEVLVVSPLPSSETLREVVKQWQADRWDTSIWNRSAAVLAVRHVSSSSGWRALLCADARQDEILEAVACLRPGQLPPGQWALVSLPHHGSGNNSDQHFPTHFPSDAYVMSCNGHHKHPSSAAAPAIQALDIPRRWILDGPRLRCTYPVDKGIRVAASDVHAAVQLVRCEGLLQSTAEDYKLYLHEWAASHPNCWHAFPFPPVSPPTP